MQQSQNHQVLFQFLAVLIGGGLSIFGGFAAALFRIRLERKQEIDQIATSLSDELSEICDIIRDLKATYNNTSTHIISESYLSELLTKSESYNSLKQRLFLINDATLRQKIKSFYKTLNKNISESKNKVNTLGEKQTGTEHDKIVSDCDKISADAGNIIQRLTEYKS